MKPSKVEAVNRFLVADGLVWTAGWHRLSLLPARRRTRVLKLDERAETFADTTRPYPYLHSVTNPLVDMTHPAAASEWLAVATLATTGRDLAGDAEPEPGGLWKQLATQRSESPSEVRVRIGVGIALGTIAREGLVSWSGNDNPHYFDDWSLLYGLASAVSNSDANTARVEAQRLSAVTHALDGVWCASAFAILLARLAEGSSRKVAVDSAIAELPQGSWARGVAEEALDVVAGSGDSHPVNRAVALERTIVDHVYSYPVAGPETLALLLAHLVAAESLEGFLVSLLLHPSKGDLLPALGYATTALVTEWPQSGVTRAPALDGVAVKKLAGFDLVADIASRHENVGASR